MNKILRLKTPAKINLYLRVLSKRADNYHEIETVFLPLESIYDEVMIAFHESRDGKIQFFSDSGNIPSDETNLCCRAARAYMKEASLENDLSIELKKNIPVAAGMGGGSSDAGAVLRMLQDVFNAVSNERLYKIAASIGADVPFFLNPVSSSASCIGEVLKPIDMKISFRAVICAPSFPVSAAWAYKNIQRGNPGKPDDIVKLKEILTFPERYNDLLPFLINDLANALYDKFPVLELMRDDLLEAGLDRVQITGSGPTLFGITRDAETAAGVVLSMNLKYGAAVRMLSSQISAEPFKIEYE